MEHIETRLEQWKKQLLDLGKQNRLIHYKETKRGNLRIVSPDLDQIYEKLVDQKSSLLFPEQLLAESELCVRSNQSFTEQQHILKGLKDKAKTALEEQGVHILYLAVGFLKWQEKKTLEQFISPIVLLPVKLIQESLAAPYQLKLTEGEIQTNPTLQYKLSLEEQFLLPDFHSEHEAILDYLISVNDMVHNRGWEVELECSLNLFSFLKMNMYQDLTNNADIIKLHPILKAFGGDLSEIQTLSSQYHNYNHDYNSRPNETFQVLDADSSQQDAILYSKKGISFVLQGPPGTGKSQTITNMIAEALAENKKILFVSEKMAALEVVYKRLQEVGISDFCLPLHSHKANKKEVLEELNRTLHLNKVSMPEDMFYQLDKLSEHRKRLDGYASQLHTVCEPLGLSVYEINGRLAKLYLRPDLDIEIKNIDSMNQERLHQLTYLVSEYQTALENLGGALKDYPLYGARIGASSHDKKSEVENHLAELLPKWKELSLSIAVILEEFHLNMTPTLGNIAMLLKLFRLVTDMPSTAVYWLNSSVRKKEDKEELKQLLDCARNQEGLQRESVQLKKQLEDGFLVDYEELKANEAIKVLSETMNYLHSQLNPKHFGTNNEILASLTQLIRVLEQENTLLEEAIKQQEELALELGLPFCETIEEFHKRERLLELISYNPRPTKLWFDYPKWKHHLNKIREIKGVYQEAVALKEEIIESYHKEIFELDAKPILQRFETDYQGVMKKIKKEYRIDMALLSSLYRDDTVKYYEEDAIYVLDKLCRLNDHLSWLDDSVDWMQRFLGVYYQKEDTNWVVVEQEMAHFYELLEFYKGEKIPTEITEILIAGKGNAEKYKQAYYNIRSITYSENVEALVNILRCSTPIEQIPLTRIKEWIVKILNSLTLVEQIFSLLKIDHTSRMPYSEGISLYKKLVRYQNVEDTITKKQMELKQKFPSIYKGRDTDWKQVMTGIQWMNEVTILTDNSIELTEKFLVLCCNEEKRLNIKETMNYLQWLLGNMQEGIQWVKELYSHKNIENERLYCMETNLEYLYQHTEVMEQWLSYEQAKGRCVEEGLYEFVVQVEEMELNPSIITETFSKRVYQLWLDNMVPKLTNLNDFQSNVRDMTRIDFDKLDVDQLYIARRRIKERLVSLLPKLDVSTCADDEVGILKRELSKKQKQMPLRQLISQIPHVLQLLKPCFLMSPLSVSMYLDSDRYHFDLVIFDEASQIRTEEGIGAILRADQVIIAGDSEQLPPTSFFQTAVSNVINKDIETEGFIEVQGESILEEALQILPERMLCWHYRSRHESLIAFSNAQIYDHNLITFPSTVDKMRHQGVEYCYVENGCYDRGGKKHNVAEALKVAELIIEHFTHTPNRSLGVITFSEAQSEEVKRRLHLLRLSHPELDEFFDEERIEPFFVKNLENVQGDERDTIIFSIGYGKDEQGDLMMNFGPLSRTGGYRRLNVAITRAKYNIKLVGSILPEELSINKNTAQGVRMLKAYLMYAIERNQDNLGEETDQEPYSTKSEYDETRNDWISLEKSSMIGEYGANAPFEEAVYEYLISHGYEVDCNVGSSSYRIDMAVRHPNNSSQYVLGIECDGEMYHGARTVRERERLRQTVMSSMGWRLYRIWSTDWVKNPFIEGQKLLEEVEQAIAQT